MGRSCGMAEVAITLLADAWSYSGRGFTHHFPGGTKSLGDRIPAVGMMGNLGYALNHFKVFYEMDPKIQGPASKLDSPSQRIC